MTLSVAEKCIAPMVGWWIRSWSDDGVITVSEKPNWSERNLSRCWTALWWYPDLLRKKAASFHILFFC